MKRKWTKKDGTRVWIRDMDDDHLLSVLKMLQRYAWHKFNVTGKYLVDAIYHPLTGENAADCLERQLQYPWTYYIPDEYRSLLAYAKKRGFWNQDLELRFNLHVACDWADTTSPPYWSKRSVWEGVAPEDIIRMEIENAG